jgi:integrase
VSPEELQAVVRAEPEELYAAIYVAAAFTGLRMGELRALRWADVDFAKRLVHVRRSYTGGSLAGGSFGAPKSRRVRSVPMSDQVARVLDALSRRADDARADDLVFTVGRGIPVHHDWVRKRFYAALEGAGLGRLRGKADPRLPRPAPHLRHPGRTSVPAV